MNHPRHIICGASSPLRRICRENAVKSRPLSACRRFAFLLLLCAASCAFAACSPVDSAGTIPRSDVRAPRKPHRLTVIKDMLFEFGSNPLEKKTVNLPEGEYVFEGEDDIFMYFRSPEPLEYRVNHKEGFAEGFFQMGGLALANPAQWGKVKYPVCTYTDGEDQSQKRLTCPLDPAFVIDKRGFEWESDFDAE